MCFINFPSCNLHHTVYLLEDKPLVSAGADAAAVSAAAAVAVVAVREMLLLLLLLSPHRLLVLLLRQRGAVRGDVLVRRVLRKETFEFHLTFKLWEMLLTVPSPLG